MSDQVISTNHLQLPGARRYGRNGAATDTRRGPKRRCSFVGRASALAASSRRFRTSRAGRGDSGARSGWAFVAAHELGGFVHVAGERSLELAPPGTQADGEPGVERVQPEEVAVWAVPGRRARSAEAADPEVVAPLGGGRLALGEPPASGSMFQASQCVKVPTGASGSSTISASARVCAGGSLQDSTGRHPRCRRHAAGGSDRRARTRHC
jgi:hypothetical protein